MEEFTCISIEVEKITMMKHYTLSSNTDKTVLYEREFFLRQKS